MQMNVKCNIGKECSGCTACASICPKQCITMEADEEGFLYPNIQEDQCIQCGLCQKVCMIGRETGKKGALNSYAAMNSNLDIRMASSSGGLFALLSEKVISENGVVFGAVLSDDCKSVRHTIARDSVELRGMYGSKYAQSDLCGVYPQVKKELSEGKTVMFTGTPCQVNGLHLYLGREYENLLLVDIICHGVPSPVLWRKYIERIERKYRSKVRNVNFRSKEHGWETFGLKRIDENNRELFVSKDEDPYMQMFLKNYCLRPSCYQCNSKGQRYSDITLGDFWGIENVFPEMNDGKGISAVIVRTEKGKWLLDQVKNKLHMKETEYASIVQFNAAEIQSVYRPIQRDTFFEDFSSKNFCDLQRKYLKKSAKNKIRNILLRAGLWKYIRPDKREGEKNNLQYYVTFRLENSTR